MTPGDMLTLKEACARMFNGSITPSTLKAEIDRGNLAVYQIGRRYYVTVAGLAEMVEKCRVTPKAPASITTRRADNGSSATVTDSSAQASLAATLAGLKRL